MDICFFKKNKNMENIVRNILENYDELKFQNKKHILIERLSQSELNDKNKYILQIIGDKIKSGFARAVLELDNQMDNNIINNAVDDVVNDVINNL